MTPTKIIAGAAVAFGAAMLFMTTAPEGATPRGVVAAAGTPVEQGRGRGNATAELYDEYCGECHGTDLGGGRAPSLFDQAWLDTVSDRQLITGMAEGVENTEMEGFSEVLTEDEMWALVRYIRGRADTMRPREPFTPDFDGRVIESEEATFRIETVADGLDTPWGLDFLPDGRWLVTERSGTLRVIENGELSAPVSGTPEAHVQQDGGMLDVIVHPDYAENGWIYLGYTEAQPGWEPPPPSEVEEQPAGRGRGFGDPNRPPSMTVVVRGKLNADNALVDQEEIFRADNELYTTNGAHYGLRFIFDGENHLFFSIGDRGNMENAQDLGNPLGKVHRVNDDGSIPADNPFVGQEGAVESIWVYGNRNPQGLAWGPETGLLWEAEHGPGGGDEINIIERGENYGWGVATMGSQGGITERSVPGMVDPIVYYNPTLAPSSIAFYGGDQFPNWQGDLFVAALRGEQLRRLEISGREVTHQEALFEHFGRIRDVVTGPDGLLYLLQQNPTGGLTGLRVSEASPGAVLRLVPVE